MNIDAIKQSDSASFKKKNPHIFGMHGMIGAQPVEHAMSIGTECDATVKPKPKKKRIRQSEKPLLNKLETEFFRRLEKEMPTALTKIYPQSIRLRLANGLSYCPDFFVFHRHGCPWAYEVKGKHAWDDAIVKIKCAAATYSYITFYLVWKDAQGQWQEQHVLP